MSSEYYKRLERGNAAGVSEAVIDGVSRALQLDEAEHAHLYDLVRTANAGAHPQQRARTPRKTQLTSGMRQTIDAMSTVPVYIQNGRLDAVATNRLGAALFSEMLDGARPPPMPRDSSSSILAPRPSTGNGKRRPARSSRSFAPKPAARPTTVSSTDLVGELSTRSDLFRKLWGAHDVREHRTGLKLVHHPGGRRPRPHLSSDGSRVRPRTPDDRLLRRTRIAHPRTSPTARQCGRNRPARGDALDIGRRVFLSDHDVMSAVSHRTFATVVPTDR